MSLPSAMSLAEGIAHLQFGSLVHVFHVPGGQGLHSMRLTCRPFCQDTCQSGHQKQ
jgi:hypothetical protein